MKGALLLLAATLAGAVGCADNSLSISILQMEAVTQESGCVAMPSTGGATIGRSRGVLDVALVAQSGYIAAPIVRNNLQAQMVMNDIEHNSVDLEGFNVELEPLTSAAGALPADQQRFFYAAAGGHVDPLGTAAVFAEILPAAAAMSLASAIPAGGLLTVTAHVSPVGKRAGERLVGAPFDFPIDLCVNCLRQNLGTCPLPAGTMVQDVGCFPQQDDVFDCCVDASGAALCGASAPISM